jgi:cyanate permease
MCLYLLPDRPSQARWLAPNEQAWLEHELVAEQKSLSQKHGDKLRDAFTNWRVFVLALINFCGIIGSLGIGLWLPQIVKEFGLRSSQVGIVTAIPYAVGAVSMLLWARRANQSPNRLRYVVTAMLVAAAALAVSAFLTTPVLKMLAITLTVSAILSFQATFWAIPSGFLTGRAAAGGLALIVSIGNLGGFVGPSMIGFIREATNSFTYPLLSVAGALLIGATAMLLLGDPAKASR